MVDCPHEVHCVKKVPTNLKSLICSVCKVTESPWLCLSCGIVHCGRFINGHAKLHYAQNKSHCISIDCNSLEAFCYSCDEYIRNIIPRPITAKLNAIHELENKNANNSSPDDSEFDLLDHQYHEQSYDENSKSSKISSSNNNNMTEPNDESNSSYSSSLIHADETTSCDQNISSNHNNSGNKRTVIEFGGDGGFINGGVRTRRTSSSKIGNLRSRSNNGRFQKSNRNVTSPSSAGQQQRNLRKKSGDTNNSEDDLNNEGIDDGVSDSKRRKLDDNHRSAKSDNNNRSTINSNSPRKNYSPSSISNNNNNNRRAKENNESMDKTQHKHGIVGLRNLGNTCFMNSVLQSLSKINEFSCYISHIPPPDELRSTISSAFNGSNSKPLGYSTRSRKNLLLASQNSIISNNLDKIDMNSEEFLTSELRKILILLNTKGSAAVSPDGLFTIIWEVMPRFRGYQQQDAHEFLRYMLDRIHVELIHFFPSWDLMTSTKPKKSSEDGIHSGNGKSNNHRNNGDFLPTRGYKARSSIVTSMFGGTLQNEVRCGVCGVDSKKNDPFLDLSLDIPQSPNGDAKLEDCLSRFIDVEELSDADKYFCSNCKTHQKSTKRFWIRRLPNVLCLHLKRFRWANYLRTKLDHYVQFPLTALDMSDYLLRSNNHTRGSNESFKYDLAAVIVHHGSGVGTGHYTAFAKKDGQWYHFNDSTVKPSEESVVAKCKAYILFYTRNEPKS